MYFSRIIKIDKYIIPYLQFTQDQFTHAKLHKTWFFQRRLYYINRKENLQLYEIHTGVLKGE